MILLFNSMLVQTIILQYRPFKEPVENYMGVFNELMVSLYIYFLIPLTDFNQTRVFNTLIGWGLLGTLFFTVFVNLIKLVILFCIAKSKTCTLCNKKVPKHIVPTSSNVKVTRSKIPGKEDVIEIRI